MTTQTTNATINQYDYEVAKFDTNGNLVFFKASESPRYLMGLLLQPPHMYQESYQYYLVQAVAETTDDTYVKVGLTLALLFAKTNNPEHLEAGLAFRDEFFKTWIA